MKVTPVDERDSSWEDDQPTFRVYLHPDATADTTVSSTATYDITGADVLQVIDWAQEHVGDGVYAVALVREDADRETQNPDYGRGLVWLVGRDGNGWPGIDASETHALDRMLERRTVRVGIPEADRASEMPPEADSD